MKYEIPLTHFQIAALYVFEGLTFTELQLDYHVSKRQIRRAMEQYRVRMSYDRRRQLQRTRETVDTDRKLRPCLGSECDVWFVTTRNLRKCPRCRSLQQQSEQQGLEGGYDAAWYGIPGLRR